MTLPFKLNNSKVKALYRLESYINFYAYFNRLLLLTNFLILTFNIDYMRLEMF